MNEDERQDMDDWADKIVSLEPDVIKGVLQFAQRLAIDQRLSQADRDFAQFQVESIKKARRRKK